MERSTPDPPPRPNDIFEVPATLWFAALERALRDGDMAAAGLAHRRLAEHGIRVSFTRIGSPPRKRRPSR